MPPPQYPDSLIARHEAALFAEARDRLKNLEGNHRSERFNRDILPLSLPLIEALGYRMAFEAARDASIDWKLMALYESGVIKEDSAWYAEQGAISRQVQQEMEAQALDALLPNLADLVQETGAQPYSNAPIACERLSNEFISELQTFSGDASINILDL